MHEGAKVSEPIRNLANNIQGLRVKRGLSLTGLAELSGVGKATLSAIEAGRGNPTLGTLWALASALETPFSNLLVEGAAAAKFEVEVSEPNVSVRLIERSSSPPWIEVYVMHLDVGGHREASPHPPGVKERMTVLQGTVLAGPSTSPSLLRAGDFLTFPADQPHCYSAVDGKVTALTIIEYPVTEAINDPLTVIRPLPLTLEEWDGVGIQLQRGLVETIHGLPAFRMIISPVSEDNSGVLRKIASQFEALGDTPFGMLLKRFIAKEEESVHLIMLGSPLVAAASRAEAENSPNGNPVFEIAARLYLLAARESRQLSEETLSFVKEMVSHTSLTVSTIAAEIMTQRGSPSVPPQVFGATRLTVGERAESENPLFEDRINVHAYNAYELVHPAYSRQVVLLAGEILKRFGESGEPVACLDVGTGPGLPLLMLLELCPRLQVTAIEPSPTSFAYLVRNLAHMPNVNPVQVDFLACEASEDYPLIVSVGASHHLNTSFFLQHAWRLLANDGLLMVADEFVSPFATPQERMCRLIQHHVAYLVATLVPIPEEVVAAVAPAERMLIEKLASQVPLIAFEALSGRGEAAATRCRKLMEGTGSLKLPATVSDPLLAFHRFHLLELEALLAGLDYEVERKTYPEHLVAIAEAVGFTMVEHRRVYATAGRSEFDAGTHVFVFAKGGASYAGK